jgi:hypothetical protein
MPIRSMTGYAQVKGQINDQATFTLSLKSVESTVWISFPHIPRAILEMKLAAAEDGAGHVQITLSVDRTGMASG